MNKIVLLLILLAQNSFAQKTGFVHWSESRKLNWSDFKAVPDLSSPNAAITNTDMRFNLTIKNDSISFYVECIFNPIKSWGKLKTPYILLHEQSHFDIAEIHARILHKKLKDYKWVDTQAEKDLNGIFEGVMKSMLDMQHQYDNETDFSRNQKNQEMWNEKIRLLLEEWKAYKNYHQFNRTMK